MTFTFTKNNPIVGAKSILLGKINSTIDASTVKAVAKSYIQQCDAVFVSCTDKPELVSDAKSKLLSMAKAHKFEDKDVTVMDSKFEGVVSMVMNKVKLVKVDDNSDLLMELLLGN
tara:strand:+ start:857 stop:1201 length:345 start_codon:yes stop_codon:yes gene_type:complete